MIHERGMIMILALELIINHSDCRCNKPVLHVSSGSMMSAGNSRTARSHTKNYKYYVSCQWS